MEQQQLKKEEEVTAKPVINTTIRPDFMEPTPTKSPSPKNIKSPGSGPGPKLKTE